MKFELYEKGIVRRIFGLLLFLGFPFLILMDIFAPIIAGIIGFIINIFNGIVNYRQSIGVFKETYSMSYDGLMIFIGKKD